MSDAPFPATRFQNFNETSDPAQVAPRVATLRARMQATGVDAFLIPRADVHRGESVPPGEQRLAYMTGFTGSAGMAIVATHKAALFVDGRYTLQAPAQTDTNLFEIRQMPAAKLSDWIKSELDDGVRVGFDPWLHTPTEIKSLRETLGDGVALIPTDNLVDADWPDRPAPPLTPVELLGNNRAGKTAEAKIADLQKVLVAAKADALVLSLPESICWLFNIRGRDVPNTPVTLGFAILRQSGKPDLFIAGKKLGGTDADRLRRQVNLHEPDQFISILKALGAAGETAWIDPATVPEAVKTLLTENGARLVEKSDPVLLPKSKKNDAELTGMREAHQRDGVAMAKFLCWFDANAPTGELTETGIATALEAFRSEDETLVDISFETISGAGPHGAIVHYRVTHRTDRSLMAGELMLIDSGGQYLSGTTDITRTMATGPVSGQQKDHFTRVLKGMIAVSAVSFPKGTNGAAIDTLAREALWQVGLNYMHGTGHGVGAYLGVHEGPIGISSRNSVPFEPGMIVSNEPGFYLEGQYGIRIENLLHVIDDPAHKDFLTFETLTLCPIDTRLIDLDLLSTRERDWLNAYHARVAAEIGPKVDGEVGAWLEAATLAI